MKLHLLNLDLSFLRFPFSLFVPALLFIYPSIILSPSFPFTLFFTFSHLKYIFYPSFLFIPLLFLSFLLKIQVVIRPSLSLPHSPTTSFICIKKCNNNLCGQLRGIVGFCSQQQNQSTKDGEGEVIPSLPTLLPPSNPLKALKRLAPPACLCPLCPPVGCHSS